MAESWKDLGTNTVKGLPDAVGGGFVADGKRLYEEPETSSATRWSNSRLRPYPCPSAAKAQP
ncbi:hypothetical protein I540_3960 [Mycobacteroides abscessus subsp. bolletii 1513]|uniref:Uncharacterized protein n=1 Tax=Mycobacteroides abscessus subsp. bolletii 1513 TaxID=1299321 RepID=X8DUT5_9MYCO|nr:hypothetical protein I540_3960 [Mycobacteroides abscessus subsp. bolletii 1513]